ncbi:MAG: xylulokinase [Thermofilaceae archaeon]|nr:xylulokinase [Thermofilaceae archaeon]MDW8003500.1 xylulokinase [Thermofilaceae archaeon]
MELTIIISFRISIPGGRMPYFLGIDVGTTGSKAVLVDEQGRVVSSHTTEYPLYTPKVGWTEQLPDEWWTATVSSIKAVLEKSRVKPDEIQGVGLTGQMHGLVMLDRERKVIRPAILWNDQRTGEETQFINEKIGLERILTLTGNVAHTGFTAPKLLWVKKHEPHNFGKMWKFMLPKDYVGFKLTGEVKTDVNDASGTSLFNVEQRSWSSEIVEELGIPHEALPDVLESPEVRGEVTSEASTETGLPKGTIVVAGAGDQGAAGVGAGVVEEGVVSVNIGTSGVVFTHSSVYRYDPKGRLHAFCHAVPGSWHLMGVMLSAGGSLRWFRDRLGQLEKGLADLLGVDPYELLCKEAEHVPPGSEGLIFLPYLTGERTPHADPYSRGVFFGLSLKHGRQHMVRAILEGVCYGLRDSLELILALGVKPKEVRVLGGGARSQLWRQILSDVYGIDVYTMEVDEGSSFGAAILASVGVGAYSSVERAVEAMVRKREHVKYSVENNAVYTRYYRLYKDLYPALKEKFRELAQIV